MLPRAAIGVQSRVGCAAALMRVALTGDGEETCEECDCCGSDGPARAGDRREEKRNERVPGHQTVEGSISFSDLYPGCP